MIHLMFANISSFERSRKTNRSEGRQTLKLKCCEFSLDTPVKKECPVISDMADKILLPFLTSIYVTWGF
jgi:hypothetical protein